MFRFFIFLPFPLENYTHSTVSKRGENSHFYTFMMYAYIYACEFMEGERFTPTLVAPFISPDSSHVSNEYKLEKL